MMTMNSHAVSACLADAAYADELENNMTGPGLEGKLTESLTPKLAKLIADNFQIASTIDLEASTGFNATVWRGVAGTPYAGQIHVSMRGTSSGDDLLADVALALGGSAGGQVLDMVNWWLRITTPTGHTTEQYAYSLETQAVERLMDAPGEGRLRPEEIAAGVFVNGHSLGGYLAAAFTRLLGNYAAVRHTTTFNSAGFASGSDAVFDEISAVIGSGLGRPFPGPKSSEQSNVYASKGINVVADNEFYFEQKGHRVAMFIEEGTGFPNHSMYKLTDALALAAAIEKLSVPGLTVDAVATLLEQTANTPMGSLEGMLDGLRRTLLGPSVAPTPIGDAKDSAPTRVTFHENLDHLQRSDAFAAMAGKLTLSPAFDTSATRTDFAALLSLTLGLPFQARTNDTGATSALSTVHDSAYVLWEDDRGRLQAGADSLSLNFTEDYLRDRAAFLAVMARYNGADRTTDEGPHASGPMLVQTQYVDVDVDNGRVLNSGNASRPVQRVRFSNVEPKGVCGADRLHRLHRRRGALLESTLRSPLRCVATARVGAQFQRFA